MRGFLGNCLNLDTDRLGRIRIALAQRRLVNLVSNEVAIVGQGQYIEILPRDSWRWDDPEAVRDASEWFPYEDPLGADTEPRDEPGSVP